MPIPNSKETDTSYFKIEIFDEVIRGKVNWNSRYSFIRRKIIEDVGDLSRNPAISIPARCNKITNSANFIVKDRLEEDALLGRNFLEKFNIKKV